MALNMSKHDLELMEALRRKQKAINKQRSEFKKQILENKDFVLQVLKENDAKERHFVAKSDLGGPGVHPGI